MEQLNSTHDAVTGHSTEPAAAANAHETLPTVAACKADGGCPMDNLLRLLMGPWTTYILWLLQSKGPQRFGELKRQLTGISAKVLTERLRMLEKAAIIYREQENTIPPKVTYGFTPRGTELKKVLGSLDTLARKWASEGQSSGSVS